MNLLDAVCRPWAVIPEVYETIREVYDRHVFGEKLSKDEIASLTGKKAGEDRAKTNRVGSVAVIDVIGPMSKRMNLFHDVSGGASTELIGRDFRNALSDRMVDGIVLNIDSPGGAVDGTQELANLVFASRGGKPIATYSDGMICSAAIWIGAAADEVFIASPTVDVGSIGVRASHVDRSKWDESMGIKRTEIVAGKYKNLESPNAPLSKEGREMLQAQVDYLYEIFVGDIAKFRGVSVEKVLNDMADGRIFIGKQALDAGLVDGIESFESVISAMGRKKKKPGPGYAAAKTGRGTMDLKELKEKDPEAYAQLMAEAKATAKAETEAEVASKIAPLIASNEQMKQSMASLTDLTKAQEKRLALLDEEKQLAHADRAAARILETSKLPKKLYPKVRGMIDHNKFVKEGESFGPNTEAEKRFVEAFHAEVKDWEESLPSAGAAPLGGGLPKEEGESVSAEADRKRGQEIAREYLGTIRSDQKTG